MKFDTGKFCVVRDKFTLNMTEKLKLLKYFNFLLQLAITASREVSSQIKLLNLPIKLIEIYFFIFYLNLKMLAFNEMYLFLM